jgi:anion-transporting  ArsA/GET3 family ATPase
MSSLLERKLIVVTGKGGVGKTTVACALGMLAARRRLRTIVIELGDQHRIPDLFAAAEPATGDPSHPQHHHHMHQGHDAEEVELRECLWSTSIDPDRALIEWLHTLTGRLSARLLASSSTFHYFAAAAPGAKELVTMVKVRELCEGRGAGKSASSDANRDSRRQTHPYDLVVLDAPATGHALAMLRSPQTFTTIVRAGPLAEQAQGVRELLEDPRRTGYVAVAHATEMAVTETLELEEGLRRHLDRDLDAVIVNGTVPQRFTRDELELLAARSGKDSSVESTEDATVTGSAARMARAIHERARVQQSQIARLRRQRFAAGMPPGVITVPFAFAPELDLAGVREIAAGLERKL